MDVMGGLWKHITHTPHPPKASAIGDDDCQRSMEHPLPFLFPVPHAVIAAPTARTIPNETVKSQS